MADLGGPGCVDRTAFRVDDLADESDEKAYWRLLTSHEVEYLLIGGYAVNYHGYPRATGDIDLWIDNAPGNAARSAAAVRQFGFARASETDFGQPGKVIPSRR